MPRSKPPVANGIPLTTVLRTLRSIYKPPKTFLRWRTPLDLVVVTILSAQCTDRKVNEVSRTLFRKYRKAQDYVKARQSELERDILSTGFYRTKARHIQALCHMLLQEHGGRVPATMDGLVRLPGVGRKTAAIVLYAAFGKNEGVACDTHVIRLSRRLGLTREKAQDKIERDLMKRAPRRKWGEITPLMISHGRAVCTAKNRKCEKCVFKRDCPSSRVMHRPDRAKS